MDSKKTVVFGVMLLVAATSFAAEVVNVYSARHYDTDDVLYENFTTETGIEVNLIEGNSDALLARLEREGDLSPADVFMTVDAGRLFQAEQRGIFAPARSRLLEQRVPARLRHPDGLWFGLSKRARILLVSRERVAEDKVLSYEDLAKPEWKDRVLIRSSSNVYNQSLVGSMIAAHGEAKAEEWCRGLVANMARTPQGGDRDQIRGVAAGEADVAVANSYYFAHMLNGSPEDRAVAAKVRVVFPNQGDRGTHVNISGIGVLKSAPNPRNAVRFIEYLTSDAAQKVFAGGNYEYPVVQGADRTETLDRLGDFEEDVLNASVFGNNNQAAVRMMDRAGWR
ncbi:MAG: Fe(3+) ABC transporter substrate-binding protein [Acidobacteriota bacterium]|nr:Fe(3+) ABC transporter substrate-binding protein [Acidobacteriota bacterium]